MVLNRRLERIKVMQALYAFRMRDGTAIGPVKQDLIQSLKGTEQLYLVLLSLLKEIRRYFLRSGSSLASNRVLEAVDNSSFIDDKLEQENLRVWEETHQFIERLVKKISDTERFKKYETLQGQIDLEEETKFIVRLYRKVIATDPELYDCIEAFNINWQDDLPYVNTFLVKTLFAIGDGSSIQSTFLGNFSQQEHYKFPQKLFEKTASNYDDLLKHIDGRTPKWDQDRIALMDKVIICMAVSEFLYFDDIPEKVTLNEYIDISKEYSGPKSSIFINGILDVISKSLFDKRG